jgi:hypothetical protein
MNSHLAIAKNGVTMTSEERITRSLDGTLPAHIAPLSTAKIDAVSKARIRRAWAELAQGNIEDVQTWLHQVAAGSVHPDTGQVITNPNPGRAIELFIEIAKFSTPQVKAVSVEINDGKSVKRMSVAELEASIVGDGT